MININISSKFLSEKKYIIDIIFNEFLGLTYKINIRNCENYEIILNNNKIIIIKDYFFKKHEKEEQYLSIENIPKECKFIKKSALIDNNIPIIFGKNQLNINPNRIISEIDIFSSSFFMLTRWEEYVNKKRDLHNRFPLRESYAYKNKFYEIPVVNEYVEILWKMLVYLGCKQERKKRSFNKILTHDIDLLLFSSRSILKTVSAELFFRKNVSNAFYSLRNIIKGRMNKDLDLFNNFNYLMNLSEKYNLKSYFFFMGINKKKNNGGYPLKSKFIKSIIGEIIKRGHIIGFHPGYETYNNYKKWKQEYELLSECFSQKITCGRQHFLRFDIPLTFQIWEDNKMEWESSLGFSEKEGFRCGTCYEFSTFNIKTRQKLKLKEKPLIVMDDTIDNKGKIEKVINIKNTIKRFNGDFVLLWHNSSFNIPIWENGKQIYEEILKNLS